MRNNQTQREEQKSYETSRLIMKHFVIQSVVGRRLQGSAGSNRTEQNCTLGDNVITVFWQACRGIREQTAVSTNKGCHDVGLRKQHLGYHNSWDYWYFILLYGFVYCTVLMLAVVTDGRWKLAATYCNKFSCQHCDMMLQTDPGRSTPCRMPASSTANIIVTVNSTRLHYMTLHRKFLQYVY